MFRTCTHQNKHVDPACQLSIDDDDDDDDISDCLAPLKLDQLRAPELIRNQSIGSIDRNRSNGSSSDGDKLIECYCDENKNRQDRGADNHTYSIQK